MIVTKLQTCTLLEFMMLSGCLCFRGPEYCYFMDRTVKHAAVGRDSRGTPSFHQFFVLGHFYHSSAAFIMLTVHK